MKVQRSQFNPLKTSRTFETRLTICRCNLTLFTDSNKNLHLITKRKSFVWHEDVTRYTYKISAYQPAQILLLHLYIFISWKYKQRSKTFYDSLFTFVIFEVSCIVTVFQWFLQPIRMKVFIFLFTCLQNKTVWLTAHKQQGIYFRQCSFKTWIRCQVWTIIVTLLAGFNNPILYVFCRSVWTKAVVGWLEILRKAYKANATKFPWS